ncbi:MAG TPA: MFS transporter [Bryobacteraceae bacterium]|nr:MFS transporter [Bryobacteraceae bacterium]
MTSAAVARSQLAKWQTVNVVLLVVGYAGYYLCRSNLSVTMPLIIRELAGRGMSASAAQVTLGSIASLGVLAYAIGKFPSGSLADVFGGRRNFLFGMGGSIAFTLLFASTGAVPIFTLAWMGNRLVQSLGWASAVKIISRWFTFQRYGTVMGITSLSYLFGDAAARQFMGLLMAGGFGWRGVFFTTAAVLAALLLACTCLRESPAQVGEAEPSANPDNLFSKTTASSRRVRLRELLRPFFHSPVFWVACALSLGTTILRETFNIWTPTYFTQVTGMSAARAASTSALLPFFGGISVILCGWLSDRLGRGGRAALMLGGLALAGFALLALASGAIDDSRMGPVAVVTLVAFLVVGPYSFLGGAVALDFGGKQGSGTASGIIDGVGYLGGIVSGDSMARISVSYGWGGAFIVLAVVAFLSSLAAVVFLRHEREIGK